MNVATCSSYKERLTMNVIYNSDNYYVIQYPEYRGYEVVNKCSRSGTFFHGPVAEKFWLSMAGAIDKDPSSEHLDEFLSDFGVLINFSTTMH